MRRSRFVVKQVDGRMLKTLENCFVPAFVAFPAHGTPGCIRQMGSVGRRGCCGSRAPPHEHFIISQHTHIVSIWRGSCRGHLDGPRMSIMACLQDLPRPDSTNEDDSFVSKRASCLVRGGEGRQGPDRYPSASYSHQAEGVWYCSARQLPRQGDRSNRGRGSGRTIRQLQQI